MHDQELLSLLALQKVDGVGDIVAKKLLNHCGSAQEIFKIKTSQLSSIDGVGQVLIKNLKSKTVFLEAESELNYIKNNNINFSFYKDNKYPERLKHCIDSPILLFTSGAIDLKNRKIISIVGTRQITSYGTEFCKKLIEDLAPLNPIIVSGFAYGVDIVAHQMAMDLNLQTIGVLAHGLNQSNSNGLSSRTRSGIYGLRIKPAMTSHQCNSLAWLMVYLGMSIVTLV